MKKIAAIIFVFAIFLQTFAFAGPTYQWSIPDNVRVVQPSPVDDLRVFSTIQNAISSITNASSTNLYQIKVMPGTYSTPFTLPSYISLVGSGKKSTIINIPIVINGDTTVEGIKFLSNSAASPLITVNDGFTVELENIDITVGPDSSARALQTGTASSVTLVDTNIYVDQNKTVDPHSNIDNILRVGQNGTIEIRNSKFDISYYCFGHGYVIGAYNVPSVIIDNTKITSVNSNDASELIDGGPANLVIKNSEIELDAKDGIYGIDVNGGTNLKIIGSKIKVNATNLVREIEAIHSYDGKVYIDNSVILATLNGNASSDAVSVFIDGNSNVEISNSNLSGPVSVISAPQLKIGSSKIGGGIKYPESSEYGTYKFFGCFDDNYQACVYPPSP